VVTVTTPTPPSSPAATPVDAPALVAPTVSTQWLADHLGREGLVVLDATVLQVSGLDGRPAYISGEEEYLVHGHLAGAVFADLLEVFSDPEGRFGFAKPTAAQFESAAASVGVDNGTTVVVYDTSVGNWAARLWWLFRSFGHERVAVLDGGLAKWSAEDRGIDRGYVPPRTVDGFIAEPLPGYWAEKNEVAAIVTGDARGSLVCGVPSKEYTGEAGTRPRAGHIPGSISAPAARLVSRETNALLPPDALRRVFAGVLDDPSRIVTYCAGGVAAASDALALAVIGRTDVAVYDGSLNEWAADDAAPLVTTA
jgi:thiosulfate/3-mercaptopyruvate sulfurtransferase